MIGDRELINTYLKPATGMQNPNLFIEMPPTVGVRIWDALTFPWTELQPWQIP